MLFSRRKGIGELIRRGDEAQRRGDWQTARHCYEKIVAARPNQPDIWVQLGHAAKELGEVGRAEEAYREALKRGGARSDTYIQMGHLFKLRGMPEQAVAAYADALRLDPDAIVALQHLAALGARDAIPDVVFDASRRERMNEKIQHGLGELQQLLAIRAEASKFPLRRYDLFRRTYPVPPPPSSSAPIDILVLIDARDASAADLRATLVSLLDQSLGAWTARVRAPPPLWNHPVASFALTEQKIAFITQDQPVDTDPLQWLLSLPAGVSLDPQSLAWFAFAAATVDAEAFHGDHDHMIGDQAVGLVRAHPCLYGAYDPYILIQTSVPPPVVMMRGNVPSANPEYLHMPAPEMHRRALLAIGDRGTVAHIPRVLASILKQPGGAGDATPRMSAGARAAVPALGERFPLGGGMMELRAGAGADPVAVAIPRDDDVDVRVVIPSRDAAAMLRTAVDRLFACSTQRRRLRLTIVDNRSTDPEALALLNEYRHQGIDVLVMDEPFNWSRANNLAAAASREPHLVFVNNDTEMLTPGWDSVLVGFLQRDDVGVVGARLLYPDRTLQHGGTIFTDGSPRHEGVGIAGDVPGPLGRWASTRSVGAVTGAFLAVRRDRFEEVDGFDEQRLAIAYNDVDFCLKIRSRGWSIVYTAAIELVHHESKTRGPDDTHAKVAWGFEEFRTLRERWGDVLGDDPGYNPQWADGPVPFDGLREPSLRSILRYIDRSAERHPWRADPASAV